MNCVRLDYSTIEKWHKNKWTDSIYFLFFKYYTSDVSQLNRNMKMIVYPAKNYHRFYNDFPILEPIHDSCSIPLKGELIYGNNVLQFKSLDLIDSAGNLVKFDYLRFKPVVAKGNLSFMCEMIDGGQVIKTFDARADPCPQYCPNPPSVEGLTGEEDDPMNPDQ